jgi:hypothetical protein
MPRGNSPHLTYLSGQEEEVRQGAPPPSHTYPILDSSEASAMDLCDGLSMEVMGTKTDIGQ